jgi:hypothetical protein
MVIKMIGGSDIVRTRRAASEADVEFVAVAVVVDLRAVKVHRKMRGRSGATRVLGGVRMLYDN